ncbi:hypothetical protein [Kitasatospora sp. NPDC056181]|uniref:hypothetical protein n=1 Tax=Kitasatospora sp. NPDC056181 TaxID=3345737 RepID=UPI0035DAE43A
MKIRKIASGITEMQLTCEGWQPGYVEPFRSGGCDGLLVGRLSRADGRRHRA